MEEQTEVASPVARDATAEEIGAGGATMRFAEVDEQLSNFRTKLRELAPSLDAAIYIALADGLHDIEEAIARARRSTV